MEAVKAWARSIFLLSIISSTALLIVPKPMQKQSRFVAEMLILLCVIAPLGGLIGAGTREALATPGLPSQPEEGSSLGKFFAEETARRVTEIGLRTGIPVLEVTVATKDRGFSLAEVVVRFEKQPPEEQMKAFTEGLGAYLGIGKDKVRVVIGP